MFSGKSASLRGIFAAAIVTAMAGSLSAQTTYDWNDPAGGLFQDAGNWTPGGGPPSGLDTARFALGDSYTVSFSADRTHQFMHVGTDSVYLDLSNRTYTLTGGYPTVVAGLAPGDSTALTVQNGTLVSDWAVFGLFWPGQINLELPGPVTWNNSSAIVIGGTATTQAEASNGAQIMTGWTVIGSLGGTGGGSGVLRVREAGTIWNCASNVMAVGADATGSLIVTEGADVVSGWGDIGVAAGVSGNAHVSGAGSRWDMGIGAAAIGVSGIGTLNVQGGGVVTSKFSEIGIQSSGSGSATVTGAGSRWEITPFGAGVGINGIGTLSIQSGGVVTAGGAEIGREATGDGEVALTGTNSLWDIDGPLQIGVRGDGELTIGAGATVTAYSALMGRFAGATATMTVNGSLNIESDGAYFYVGYDAPANATLSGNLTVNDPGGTVGGDDGATYVGPFAGAPSTLTILSGGSLSASAQLQLGSLAGAHGEVIIHTGGSAVSRLAASSPSGSAGNVGRDGTGVMTIAGGLWNCLDGLLNVGFNATGNGTMTINAGGTALSIGGSIGRVAGATGTVLIDGAGSDWTSSATLNVGTAGPLGSGTLTVVNGGLADAPTIMIAATGTVGGVGTLDAAVSNNGTLAPGDVPGPADIGLLTIAGSLTQAAAGKTVVDISGTAVAQRDRVQVSGAASLAGTLQVNLVGGFIPLPGQEFQIVTAGSVAGTYADISGAGSGYLEAVYDATTVKLRYCQPCDANCDGVSNGRDIKSFVNIILGTGTPCGSCAGDANRDASINTADVTAFVQCLTAP